MSYYAVLELSAQASAEEIRRAYRRLVLSTHPDRTPDPAQHRRYLAINEAYETLSDPARRAAYDAGQQRPPGFGQAEPATAPHPDPAMRRRSRARPRPATGPPLAPLHIRYDAEFRRVVPRFRFVALISLVGAVLVIADLLRTEVWPQETIQEFEYVVRGSRHTRTSYFVVSTPHTEFEVENTTKLEQGNTVKVYQTPWFGQVQRVEWPGGVPGGVGLRTTVFGYLQIILLLMVGSAVGTLYPGLRLDHSFNMGFTNSISVLLLLIYLLFM